MSSVLVNTHSLIYYIIQLEGNVDYVYNFEYCHVLLISMSQSDHFHNNLIDPTYYAFHENLSNRT